MTPEELRDLSVRLEDATGHDSIPTVEAKYLREPEPDGAILCAFSRAATMGQHDCRFRRHDPEAMWRHVHFTGHGRSWPGCETAEAVELAVFGASAGFAAANLTSVDEAQRRA